MPTALAPGFADAPRASQSVFRALMDALARPGTVLPLATGLVPPAPLTAELAAIALTLADYETPVWLDPALAAAPGPSAYLRFHSGAPLVEDPAAARFALVADAGALPDLSTFAQGEPDYPDRSATLVVAVQGFAEGPWTLDGPGIDGTRRFGVQGLPADMAERLAANRALFPLGVDLILCAPGLVAGLPRSVRVIAES